MGIYKRLTQLKKSKLAKSMLGNLFIKPVSYILNLLYTPLLLGYLGDEKYGLWATILSIISWVNLCDIGIANGLRNVLTTELESQKDDDAKKSISTAYIILSVVSLIITLGLAVVAFVFDWKDALNISYDISWIMLISFGSISINFVLGIGKTVLYVLQESEKVPLLNLCASIIQLIGIIVLRNINTADNLLMVSILFGLSSSVVFLGNDIYLAKKFSYCRISLSCFDKKKVKLLINTGLIFLILQLGGIAMTSTDNILISYMSGTSTVTPYSSATRLFSAVSALYIALIAPIWSRTSLAVAQNDYQWIYNIVKRLLKILLLSGMALFLLTLVYEDVSEIWLGERLYYENGLVICTAICSFFEIVSLTFSSVLNGMNILKEQAFVGIAQVILNIPLSIFFARNCKLGSTGVKLSTMLLVMFSSFSFAILVYRSIKGHSPELFGRKFGVKRDI